MEIAISRDTPLEHFRESLKGFTIDTGVLGNTPESYKRVAGTHYDKPII
jgi:hypothetical protein